MKRTRPALLLGLLALTLGPLFIAWSGESRLSAEERRALELLQELGTRRGEELVSSRSSLSLTDPLTQSEFESEIRGFDLDSDCTAFNFPPPAFGQPRERTREEVARCIGSFRPFAERVASSGSLRAPRIDEEPGSLFAIAQLLASREFLRLPRDQRLELRALYLLIRWDLLRGPSGTLDTFDSLLREVDRFRDELEEGPPPELCRQILDIVRDSVPRFEALHPGMLLAFDRRRIGPHDLDLGLYSLWKDPPCPSANSAMECDPLLADASEEPFWFHAVQNFAETAPRASEILIRGRIHRVVVESAQRRYVAERLRRMLGARARLIDAILELAQVGADIDRGSI